MEHSELVAEMGQVEHLSTQDRLYLARMRRAQQLKAAKQKEKEWQKAQNRKDRNANHGGGVPSGRRKKNIEFQDSVVLLEAAARNDIVEVAKLLQKGVTPDATNEDGLTALHQCCIDNNADMLRLLLDYGANVNAQDSEKWTPLHAAATCGHLNLVKFLISRGANLLAVNADGNMPYDLCDDEETLDCIEAEMSRRGVTQELIDDTRASVEVQMLHDLEELAEAGGDLEAPDHQGATPLHIAAANGYVKVVEFLLEHHASVDAVDNDMWTPVHAAACWGHMEVLELLAQSGADLFAKNKNEETPSDICEDMEIRERIEQLKTEQESKRLAEAQKRRVRRSQSSNTRAQSVRRTSLRDKTLTTKKDAVEETRLRLKAQEVYTDNNGAVINPTENGSTTPVVSTGNNNGYNGLGVVDPSDICTVDGAITNPDGDQLVHNGNHHQSSNQLLMGNNTGSVSSNKQQLNNGTSNGHSIAIRSTDQFNNNHNNSYHNRRIVDSEVTIGGGNEELVENTVVPNYNRQSPEGKDNEEFLTGSKEVVDSNRNNYNTNNHSNYINTISKKSPPGSPQDIYSDTNNNSNGKINVQVTVLFDAHNTDQSSPIAGTLADLKKHRAQSRFTTGGTAPINGNSADSVVTTANGSIVTAASAATTTSKIPIELSLVSSDYPNGTTQSFNSSSNNSKNHIINSNNGQGNNNGTGTTGTTTKFCGITGDVVSDSTRSKRCCVVM